MAVEKDRKSVADVPLQDVMEDVLADIDAMSQILFARAIA
jgi:hypothetical protein